MQHINRSLVSILAFAGLTSLVAAEPGWRNLPGMNVLEPSAFMDGGGGRVHAITQSGNTYVSADSGHTWSIKGRVPMGGENPDHVVFPSPDTGYVGGSLASIWRTVDGGGEWKRVFSEFLIPWKKIAHFDGKAGLALNRLYLLRTGDGWVTPQILRSGVDDFQILGKGRAVLLANDTLYASEDAGRTWEHMSWSPPANGNVLAFHFADAKSGFSIVETPDGPGDAPVFTLYRTLDSGATWSEVSQAIRSGAQDPNPPYAQLLFCDSLHGLTWDHIPAEEGPGQFVIGRTEDGGRTWSRISPPWDENQDSRFSIGPGGTIWGLNVFLWNSRNGGKDWAKVAGGPIRNYWQVHFQDRNRGVAAVASQTDYQYGENIYLTRDGGRTWNPHPDLASLAISSLHFADARHGFAVGDSGLVLKSSDGGEKWTPLPTPSRAMLSSVYFCDSATGMGWGSNSMFLTTDAGSTWSRVESEFSGAQLRGMALADAKHLYAWNGQDGGFWASSDGGDSWRKAAPALSHGVVQSMAFPSPDIHYAVTVTGDFLASSDSGLTWQYRESAAGPWTPTAILPSPLRLAFASADTGFSFGEYGFVTATVDGGRTWIDMRLPAPEELVVWVVPATGGSAWAMTADGSTWEYTAGSVSNRPSIGSPLSSHPFAIRNGNLIVNMEGSRSFRLHARDARGRSVWTGQLLKGGGQTNFPLPAHAQTLFLEIKAGKIRSILRVDP
jgi:photosystem II stability/assembly factor-like uncharacterized protein